VEEGENGENDLRQPVENKKELKKGREGRWEVRKIETERKKRKT